MQQLTTFLQTRGELFLFATLFLAVVALTLAVGSVVSTWSGVRRRVGATSGRPVISAPAVETSVTRGSGPDFLKGLVPTDEAKKSELTKFLNSAGYYGNAALVWFQASRIGVAIVCGILAAFYYGQLYPGQSILYTILAAVGATFIGYMLPRMFVSFRRDKLFEEHRQGFPDFLDLLVICIEAGISVDASMERISRDLATDYPSLARNLYFMSLEMRAGKSTREALENLAMRLGIPEAKSFSTLIRQSEELGTSLVTSLRIYSGEMRQKRLARAEEKAASLPAKLVLPLGLFIFPVVLGVTLLPVTIRLFSVLGTVSR